MLVEMVEAIVQAVNPQRIVLFGSHARGTAGPDSDVDLLIVEDEPFGPGRSRRRELANLCQLLARFRVPKDILLFTSAEVEQWKDSQNHVVAQALREGKVLHARPG
jgi:predicted nucleotidyltransferase